MSKTPVLSIVIPCFNEKQTLSKSLPVIKSKIRSITNEYEIIVIDDGSTDDSFSDIKTFAENDNRIKGFKFTRNFGKEAASQAGL